jgi:serine/threonine-protein kinase
VYDVSTTGAIPFVVLERLHGQTLRRLLGRPMGVAKALDYGTQVAEGLAAAHDKGIVHRDIKPENLFVTNEGRVKILDFGIAVHGGDASSSQPDVTLTAPGAAIGTAGYMAPEQARGEPVDARADVFALGAVLYEMLAGRRAFPGATGIDSVSAILTEEPPRLEAVVPGVPAGVAQVVERCLKKPREQRFQSARDVAYALDIVACQSPPQRDRRWSLPTALTATAVAALALAGAAGARWWTQPDQAPGPRRVAITMGASARLSDDNLSVPFDISRDGKILAYTTPPPERLMLRRLDEFDATTVPGTDGAYDPFFSPDGQWVGFWAYGHFKKAPVGGGPVVEVCEAGDFLGASWGDDGSIVFGGGTGQGLFMVSAAGGRAKALTTLDPGRLEIHHAFPQAVDGGRLVLFTVRTRSKEAPHFVDVYDVATQTRRSLVPGARDARYLPTGHLLYVRERTLYAMKVAAETLSPEGPAVPVLTNVHSEPAGLALFRISADGTLLYVEAAPPAERTLVWVTREGTVTETGLPARDYRIPRISPRGRLIAVSIRDGETDDIWMAAADLGTLERLTFGRSVNFTFPGFAIAPDGKRVAYSEDAEGGSVVMTQAIDAAREKQAVLNRSVQIAPSRWLPDGSGLLLDERGPTTGGDLLVATPQSGQQPTLLTSEPGNQWGGSPSADGRYLAYASNETGRFEVWVMAYPRSGLRRQVTTEGGAEPIWSPDGKEIYYRSGDRVMAIPVTTTPTLVVGRPSVLFEGSFVAGVGGLSLFDVGPDGRFLMMRAVSGREPRQLRVVFNWFEELRDRLGRAP